MDELRGILARYLTHATAESVGLSVPYIEVEEHIFEMSPKQAKEYEFLREQAKRLLAEVRFNKGADVLRLFGAMRGLALDPAFYSQEAYSFNPRYAYAAYLTQDAIKKGGKVLLFLDWVTPSERNDDGTRTGKKAQGPDAFDRLKSEMDSLGINPKRIALVTADRAPGAKRQEIIDGYNDGLYDVIIATRGSLGVGGDLQHGTTDIIHVDIPASPGQWDQTNGRGARQGNTNQSVRVHVLLARGTLDGLLYSIMRGKKGWRSQLFESNAKEIQNTEMLTYEDMLIALSPDPENARKDIEKLRNDIERENILAKERASQRTLAIYLETWLSLQLCLKRSSLRKSGKTDNDRALEKRFAMQLERYKKNVIDQSGDKYKVALEHGGYIRNGSLFTVGTQAYLKHNGAKRTIKSFTISKDNRLAVICTLDDGTETTSDNMDLTATFLKP